MLIERILGEDRRAPDILDCLSNLSSDEVFTPPLVVGRMLDLLPDDVWSNPDLKWLDPVCKTGIFLRFVASRLMDGLAAVIEDEDERREHIFNNMLYGIAITELTGQIARRSLYYSKSANSEYSVVRFSNEQGNILQRRSEHRYPPELKGVVKSLRRCEICGSPDNLDREGMENYAYTFIHEEEVFDLKFDVIVGNPPYQLEDGGHGASASPIYQHFVRKAKDLKPRYVSFVIPARWFGGGKGLDDFRAEMIADRSISHLVDYPKLFECFPGVEVKGGICYFLWDSQSDGDCKFTTIIDGEVLSESTRDLRNGGDVLIRSNQAVPILEKVRHKGEATLDSQVSARKPFGLPTNFRGASATARRNILIYQNGGTAFITKSELVKKQEWVQKWKTLTPRAADGHGRIPMKVLGKSIVAGPGEACTETYLVAGVYDTEEEARNLADYLELKLVRLLVSLRKHTQDVRADRFSFVPKLDAKTAWTDEALYERYELIPTEIEFVENQILVMPE